MKNQDRIKSKMERPDKIKSGLAKLCYLANDELSTILFLMYKLQKPLLLEGLPGVGKTDVAGLQAHTIGEC